MKKTLVLFLIGMIIFSLAAKDSMAARRSKKGGGAITQEDMDKMSTTIDTLTKKVYAASLFSPQENAQMIEIKIKLDNQMLIAPEASLAPLYYKAGNLYRAREYRKEAIDCYQTILENFSDTALAPKATKALKDMGVKVVEPEQKKTEDEKQPENGLTTGQAADIEAGDL
ncbi:TPA: hypothetical protein IAD52_03935 [Candidatus Spyradomonas excrementavium]|nr:hypothetical protein [Candidatus Spyradomonas excrementavium]